MKKIVYHNFDELFLNINKSVIEEPEEYVENIKGLRCYLHFLILESDSYDCNLNLGDLCYTPSKIKTLINNYIDKEVLNNFKKKLLIAKGDSLTLYFKNIKNKHGSNGDNGPCIISIVFTKKTRNDKYYTEANIYYRITEIDRRFYADLCLFNLIFRDMPEIVKLEKIRLIIPKAFFHLKNCLFNLDIFDIDFSKNTIILQQILKNKGYLLNNNTSYKSLNRIKKHLNKELNYKDFYIKEMKL